MATPDPIWKRLAGGGLGIVVMIAMLVVIRRFGGLSRAQFDAWGEWIVIAPFGVAGAILLYLQRRRRR